MGGVSSPAADEGARRADDLLRLLADGDGTSAEGLLGDLDVRALTFTGAGLTVAARAERHRLPPAMRAQANARQVLLAQRRDASRADADGLRGWVLGAAEEVLFLRSLPGLDRAEGAADPRR
jgi:hypothetical protein